MKLEPSINIVIFNKVHFRYLLNCGKYSIKSDGDEGTDDQLMRLNHFGQPEDVETGMKC